MSSLEDDISRIIRYHYPVLLKVKYQQTNQIKGMEEHLYYQGVQ